jgi:hypothetical protein
MQIAFLVKPLRTVRVRTNERLLPCVDAHVGLQVEVQGEALIAKIALVWFLTLKNSMKKFDLLYGLAYAF